MGRCDGAGQDERPAAARSARRRRRATALAAAGALTGLAPTGAVAQKVLAELGVSSGVEWTSNAALGEAGGGSDAIVNVRPRIRLLREGGRLTLSGFAALDGIVYANGTQPNRILPEADLSASFQAVPRLLYLDAGLRAFQTSANPFGARQEQEATTQNSVTTVLGRFSPRIQGMAGEHLRYLLRSDNNWTYEDGATTTVQGSDSAGYYGLHAASVEQDPLPLGWRLEATRSETRYRDGSVEPLVLDAARGTVLYAPDPEINLGLHGGYERTSFDTPGENGLIYGVDVKWQPSPRTLVSGFAERRFFGTSWSLAFDHRTPTFAWNILSSRTLQTSPQSVFNLPASDNVAGLLDGIFTTRYPDPTERAKVVGDFIAAQGLPTSTLQPIVLRQQRLSIVRLNVATVALIGVRNTASLSAYQGRTEDAVNTAAASGAGSFSNNSQLGTSFAFTHRLTPLYSLTAYADWSRIRALGGFGGERTTQKTVRLRFDVRVARRTNAFAGARYRQLDSNSTVSGNEEAVFVGIDHSF